MQYLGLHIPYRNIPKLDPDFIPLHRFNTEFLKQADRPVGIAIERGDNLVAVCRTAICSAREMQEANRYYIGRLVKTLLWMKGGFRIYISGDQDMYRCIEQQYAPGGLRAFDRSFMERVYEQTFEVIYTDELPQAKDACRAIGRHLNGCRIGFDAGGSDRKVSAVQNGKTVFSEEVVWHPKTESNPDYHFSGILSALETAASYLPRIDGIGISAAGIYINNRAMVASLFNKIPYDVFDREVKDIFTRAAQKFGDVPMIVCNDGDVTALSGAMNLGQNNVLGIAMGTSEAVGYVNEQGSITGWLNELAFVPVDASPHAMADEWSGDIGCGVKYFSQDSIIKLALAGGISFDPEASPAEKLKTVQGLMEADDPAAQDVYASLGVYLGHTLPYYHDLYNFKHVLLLGRVMSGKGGTIILETAKRVLHEEYSDIAAAVNVILPDENSRRVGQSIAAASLPEIEV